MKLRFNINYHTIFGEQIGIEIQTKNKSKETIYLSYVNDGNWFLEIELNDEITYTYFFEDVNGVKTYEWKKRTFNPNDVNCEKIDFYDSFTRGNFPEFLFDTKPFQHSRNVIFQDVQKVNTKTHIFKISAPLFDDNHALAIVGNHSLLGKWNFDEKLLMQETSFGNWEIQLDLQEIPHIIQYKYVVVDKKNKSIIDYETGNNRITYPNNSSNKLIIINDVYFKYPQNLLWKGSGVAIPVFSIKTDESFGVGEFLDLKKFGNLAQEIGFKIIQILPINDTTANYTWTDSYPYSAISVYALHPLYLSIENLTYKLSKTELDEYKIIQNELNSLPEVDYEKVISNKWNFIKKISTRNFRFIVKNKEFLAFLEENKDWIYDYSVFCTLRDKFNSPEFSKWKYLNEYNKQEVLNFFDSKHEHYFDVILHSFVQFELHNQLKESVDYIHTLGISLKGDLPIGIYRNSVEAWKEPEYFGMDFQAGAPPDDFAVLGQNWEFPTYNWERMKEDGYLWWRNRFDVMSQYFDAFRIDHILGFFRIWRMPNSAVQGILGYFYPALAFRSEELWERGINFNKNRLTKPYITHDLIHKYFGNDYERAFSMLFTEKDGVLEFNELFNTQRKVEKLSKSNSWLEKNKENIYTLLANVILLEEQKENETVYHPRFFLYNTDSYHALDGNQKQALYNLYIHYFFERQESLWYEKGMEKLPFLKKTTDMLTCGEDLGLVPKCVPASMNELSILSLQVQRMPSGDIDFSNPYEAPYLSVVTPSTHDTSTLRQWWEENYDLTNKYYKTQLQKHENAPDVITPDIGFKIIKQHMESPAMLAIFPLQDLFTIDYKLYTKNKDSERINIPAVFPHYWKYRMHLSVEELINNKDFISKISELIKFSNRS
ncbi:MAG: 4-alpha-glucanotransferase [Flavobacteriales bacterium]|nr:4-alpha-glucanotransferase [Flavobacteriales bacterium]